ncbi:MAG TPA: RidA family protein [Candidatus Saccharimonadales bacterium]|nr:RidA family protein [Candidatus Saccharimonadales bacterium]
MALEYIREIEGTQAFGPYSSAVKPEPSAQLVLTPGIVGNQGDHFPEGWQAQTIQALENGCAILRGYGIEDPKSRIAKVSIYLAQKISREVFNEFNQIYGDWFSDGVKDFYQFPMRTLIQAQPPLGFPVELEFAAYLPPVPQTCEHCANADSAFNLALTETC